MTCVGGKSLGQNKGLCLYLQELGHTQLRYPAIRTRGYGASPEVGAAFPLDVPRPAGRECHRPSGACPGRRGLLRCEGTCAEGSVSCRALSG